MASRVLSDGRIGRRNMLVDGGVVLVEAADDEVMSMILEAVILLLD